MENVMSDNEQKSVCRWRIENSIIYFTVTPNGWTGPGWLAWYEQNGYMLSAEAKFVLVSPEFTQTPAASEIQIAVLTGELFINNERTTGNARAQASLRGLVPTNTDIACLIRKKFSNEEMETMGLNWIVGMHTAIQGPIGPQLIGALQYNHELRLGSCFDEPSNKWSRRNGFAFAVQ